MDTLGDLVARERRSDDPALRTPRENRTYDYHRFCTTAWKTGNFWRRRGVHASDEVTGTGASDGETESDGGRAESTVAVADDPEPEVVFSFLGAALLGAKTRFGLSTDPDARVAVAPNDKIGAYEISPGGQLVGYGGPPDDPAVAHFERDVWSENPAFPERPVDPATTALVVDDREFSHADLLGAAADVVEAWDIGPGDSVAVRATLTDPGTVAAGVVAPLLAGAAILFPDETATGSAAVVADGVDAPESRSVAPDGVLEW